MISTLISAIEAHITFATFLAAIPLALGLLNKYLSATRKSQVGLAIFHAFWIVEDTADQLQKAGKDSKTLDKVASALKAANDYCTAQGWTPLSDAETVVAKATWTSMNAQTNASGGLAAAPAGGAAPLA